MAHRTYPEKRLAHQRRLRRGGIFTGTSMRDSGPRGEGTPGGVSSLEVETAPLRPGPSALVRRRQNRHRAMASRLCLSVCLSRSLARSSSSGWRAGTRLLGVANRKKLPQWPARRIFRRSCARYSSLGAAVVGKRLLRGTHTPLAWQRVSGGQSTSAWHPGGLSGSPWSRVGMTAPPPALSRSRTGALSVKLTSTATTPRRTTNTRAVASSVWKVWVRTTPAMAALSLSTCCSLVPKLSPPPYVSPPCMPAVSQPAVVRSCPVVVACFPQAGGEKIGAPCLAWKRRRRIALAGSLLRRGLGGSVCDGDDAGEVGGAAAPEPEGRVPDGRRVHRPGAAAAGCGGRDHHQV
mmetsp:Transcript_17047/g.48675  ORF Transcript_17047/g.48675 Transcript_17047/m.48675 type:complete len:349 (-) Transcript_17047:492-1538(-)